MTPNEIEGLKERINFLSRILLAYIAGIYLLIGSAGNYLLDWLERDEYVLSEFAVMPAVTIVAALVLSFFAARLYLTINRLIDQIRVTP